MKLRAIILVMFAGLLYTGLLAYNLNAKPSPADIEVDTELRPYFDELVEIYDRNGIEIDWSKVSDIRELSLPGLHGVYQQTKFRIYIQMVQPRYVRLRIYEKIIVLILAHEIAHSQGINHTIDPNSLMYFNDKYIPALLITKGMEQLIVEAYTTGPVNDTKTFIRSCGYPNNEK